MLQREEAWLRKRVPREPTDFGNLIGGGDHCLTRARLPLKPKGDIVLSFGKHIVGDGKEPDIADGDARLLLCLTQRTLLGTLSVFEMPARRAPGSRGVGSLALQQEDLISLSDQDGDSDGGAGKRPHTRYRQLNE